MGYFSCLAAQLSVRPVKDRELYEPTKADQLDMRLLDLEAKLEWLEEIRPHDPLNPQFDYTITFTRITSFRIWIYRSWNLRKTR